MKKNIAFQMFLTALFSFTVFFGCTGEEESGHVSGIGDKDMKLQSETSDNLDMKKEGEFVGNEQETEPEESGTYPGLSTETVRQIKQAYVDIYLTPIVPNAAITDVFFEPYTIVNDCVVVRIKDNFRGEMGVEHYIYINDVVFKYNGRPILVWKDGRFYELQEAYDLGFLQKENHREE